MTLLFAALILALFASAADSISRGGRQVPIACLSVGLLISWIALAGLLGRPKPVRYEILSVTEADVISAVIDEGEAIYLWLGLPGEPIPRAYVLDFNREIAEQLERARRDADSRKTQLKMRLPFERSIDRSEMFYAPPQLAQPVKIPPSPLVMPGSEQAERAARLE